MPHVLNWFEIPVSDFQRAKSFYEKVLQTKIGPAEGYTFIPGAVAGIFVHDPEQEIGGALLQASGYEPNPNGAVIYLNAGPDLSPVLSRVESAGGKILLPKTFIKKAAGYIALIRDSEGNRIGLN